MKRTILLAAAGTLIGLATLAGCKEKCHKCGRVEEAPCCGAPTATEGPVIRREGPPVEHRTEIIRPRTTTRPAR